MISTGKKRGRPRKHRDDPEGPRRGFFFFLQDYFGATDVRMLPPDERLVWDEMWFLMAKSKRPGVLLKPNGEAYTDEQLAGEIRCEIELIQRTRTKVIHERIADVDRATGQLVCRKMRRENLTSETNRRNGLKGGNPALLKRSAEEPAGEKGTEIVAEKVAINTRKRSIAAVANANDSGLLEFSDNRGGYSSSPSPSSNGDISIIQDISPPNSGAAAPGRAEPRRDVPTNGNGSPPQAPGERDVDPAYEAFANQHRETLGVAYLCSRADFVWLAKIRKHHNVDSRDSPPLWERAVENYFATPLGNYTVTDLCSRYAVFCRGPLNQYGKPGGNRDQERRDATKRAIASVLSDLDGDLQ